MERILEFAGNHTLLVLALMISFFVLVFSELRRKASSMIAISPNDAVALMNNSATVIDLRSQEAFARGHIVNAKHIPFDELDTRKETLDKSTPLVAVCDAGLNSNKAFPVTEGMPDSFGFPPCKRRRVEARFNGGDITSGGGVLLLQ